MKYKNTTTGNVIDVPCEIKGGDWIPVQSSPSIVKETVEKPVTKKRSNKNESVCTD